MRIKIPFLILIAVFLVGCSSKAQDGKVIAEVNGQKLTYDYLMDQIPPEYQNTMSDQDLAKAIDTWIDMELLYQEAAKHNLEKDKHVLNVIDQTRKSIIARKYLENGIGPNLPVTEQEIDSVYKQEKDKFTNNEATYHLGHIVLKNEKAAEAVYGRLKGGEDFAKMAGDYSEDTISMKNGGDIGFLPASALEKDMVDALNTLPVGQFTRPLASQSGYYHIFQLKEKRSSGSTMPLENVRNDITQAITAQKQQAAYDSVLTGLKAKAKINRYPLSETKNENKEKK
jgi:EpsD family peptidyl-prolyl cis-trans isomerase